MIPKAAVKDRGFSQFLEEQTGRKWQENTGLLWMDKKILAQMIQDKAARWIGR